MQSFSPAGSTSPPFDPIPRLSELDLTIRTPRLVLRPIAPGDVDALWPHVSNPEVPRFMSWNTHRDRGETMAYVDHCAKTLAENAGIVWAVLVDGAAAGTVGLQGLTWQFRAWRVDRAELGYWLAPPCWNRGLGHEAAAAATRFGFEVLGLHKITVGCIADNHASRRVIEKMGFRPVGERREHMFRFGRWWDHLDYELTVGEWTTLRTIEVEPTQPFDRL
jgi:ribosomal-protein-alanine N-acetyltransferase